MSLCSLQTDNRVKQRGPQLVLGWVIVSVCEFLLIVLRMRLLTEDPWRCSCDCANFPLGLVQCNFQCLVRTLVHILFCLCVKGLTFLRRESFTSLQSKTQTLPILENMLFRLESVQLKLSLPLNHVNIIFGSFLYIMRNNRRRIGSLWNPATLFFSFFFYKSNFGQKWVRFWVSFDHYGFGSGQH